MFWAREAHGYHTTLERNAISGMYALKVRVGITIVCSLVFDSGREAHAAYHLSPETLLQRYT